MIQRLQAKDIKRELDNLIAEASSLEPKLAERLRELNRWIKDKPPGLLTRKKLVLDFLIEVILDSTLWLKLKNLSLEDQKKVLEQGQASAVFKYWINTLFPKWFKEHDPKLQTWKQKIMASELTQIDVSLFNSITTAIEKYGGASLYRYILDLSMATDLAVSGSFNISLCIQITTVNPKLLINKRHEWEMTLRYWGIERGLLVSFNPSRSIDLAELFLRSSDELPLSCYSVHTS